MALPVNIIVIGYNLPNIDTDCLAHIIANTKYKPYVLTYFDNYDSGFTLTAIWNRFINKSDCDYICLLNNDTKVSPGWLEKMVETLESSNKIGFVGPSTNCCHSPQSTIGTAEKAAQHKDEVEIMTEPISGFCLLFRRGTWKKLNGFDEAYALYGQESDMVNRAKNLGFVSAWRKDAFVFHYGEMSVKAAKINVTKERNKARVQYWRKTSTQKHPAKQLNKASLIKIVNNRIVGI